MEVRAIAKNTGVPPRKMRLLAEMVKGKRVEDALNMLKFTPSPSADIIAKVIKSAAANAESLYQYDASELWVTNITADEAKTLKRFRARARGRSNTIFKRSSHITVIVSEEN